MNIPPGLETRVLGEDDEAIFEPGTLTKEAIDIEMDCYQDGDPAMGSANTERQIASFLYNTLLQNPLIATDPSKLYRITARLLTSIGEEPSEFLGPEPSLKDFDSPEDENTLMIEGRIHDVRAIMMENHLEHIQVHSMLQRSNGMQLLQKMRPDLAQIVLQYAAQHIEEHKAMMAQMMQMMQMIQKKGGGQAGPQGNPVHPTSGVNIGATPNPLTNVPNQDQGKALNV
jgi:hypothetical protein